MAYNSVDRCQLKTGTRPFPLLHASAVTRYDEACARGSGVRVFLPRPLAFAASPSLQHRCSAGFAALWVARACAACAISVLVGVSAGRPEQARDHLQLRPVSSWVFRLEIDLLEPRLPRLPVL